MLYFHQVGVALPTLISLRQSITKLRELVSIGPRRRDRLCARSRSPSRNRFRLHTGALELFESGAPRPQTTDAAPMRNEQVSPRAPSTLPWALIRTGRRSCKLDRER